MHSAQQMSTRAHPAAIFSTKLQRFPNMGLTVKSSDDLWPWSRHHTGDTWGWSLVTTFHRSLDTCSSDTNTGALPHQVSVRVCDHFRKVESSKIRNWFRVWCRTWFFNEEWLIVIVTYLSNTICVFMHPSAKCIFFNKICTKLFACFVDQRSIISS